MTDGDLASDSAVTLARFRPSKVPNGAFQIPDHDLRRGKSPARGENKMPEFQAF